MVRTQILSKTNDLSMKNTKPVSLRTIFNKFSSQKHHIEIEIVKFYLYLNCVRKDGSKTLVA